MTDMSQPDLFPPVVKYVVVWKRAGKLEDQRTFSSPRQAERFRVGLDGACQLAHPGSRLVVATETDGVRTYP